ncbi:MAG: hypothetical protein PHS49_01190 [Candidatus Gracilibacteria bacterium]|nr:hypothetical protein [Candidatus Gracilibacteria bacterium]
MKKTIFLIISIIIVTLFIGSTYAAINLEKKLYKDTILSTNKIKQDYSNGEIMAKKISDIFKKYRYTRNVVAVQNLQNIVRAKIIVLNKKSVLTRNDRRLLNLYNNIYYRTVLLLDYQW